MVTMRCTILAPHETHPSQIQPPHNTIYNVVLLDKNDHIEGRVNSFMGTTQGHANFKLDGNISIRTNDE